MRIFGKLSLLLILCLYLAILTKLVLFKIIPLSEFISYAHFSLHDNRWRMMNLVPFKTIIFYLFLADVNLNIRIDNLVGNIIGFAPFGFIIPLLAKKFQKLRFVVLATFSLSLVYETIQLLTGFGSFDVDDLILNTIGGILGFIPIKIVRLFMESKNSKRRGLHT